jgi:HlyD family secretion protein
MKNKRRFVALILFVIVAGIAWFVWRLFSLPPLPEGFLDGHGRIEGTEISVSSKVTGQITSMMVSEGNRLETGTPIAIISAEEVQARLAQADARIKAAEEQVKQLSTRVVTGQHHANKARVDHQRIRTLFQQGSVAAQQLDLSENALQAAEGELLGAQELLAAAKADLLAARAMRDEVQVSLSDTRIVAPVSGTVVTKAAEQGELTFPGKALVVLVDLTRPYLRVYLPEKEIGKVKLGDAARVYVDSFPNQPFEAVVTNVAQKAEFTPKDVHMPDERVTLVYGVRLEIKNPQGYLKPGMPADALIRWKPDARWENVSWKRGR